MLFSKAWALLQYLTNVFGYCFDGSEALIQSQLFGQDYSVSKSDAYWISKWILEQKTSNILLKRSYIW
jgi:hypothetical protein